MATTVKPPDSSDHPSQRRRGPRIIWAVVAAAVIGGGITLGLVDTHQGKSQTLSAAQAGELRSVLTGCQQWRSANQTEPGTDQWCTEMANWMSQYMGRVGMGPEMMWGAPSSLRSACEQWIATSSMSRVATSGNSWCESMVSWMNANVGSWSGRSTWADWMSHGPYGPGMMGGFGSPG